MTPEKRDRENDILATLEAVYYNVLKFVGHVVLACVCMYLFIRILFVTVCKK